MLTLKHAVLSFGFLVAAMLGSVGPATAAAATPYCGLAWGSLPKVNDALSPAALADVRTGQHGCYDRVVFEFGPTAVGTYGLPPWSIAVANGFVGTSGRQVPVDGNAFLSVRFSNASTVDPATGKQTFTQTDIRPGLPLVRNVKLVEDFERVMIWGVGLERLGCAKVTELAGPVRLVVDLPTPP